MALSRHIIAGVLAGLVIAGSQATAEDAGYKVETRPGARPDGIGITSRELQLSLQEAIALALEHNIDLEVSRLSLASTQKGILGATGVFDPYLSVDFTESSTTTPATNALVGADIAESQRRIFNIGLSQRLATGASLSLSWDNTRSETNSTFYFLNPSINSGFDLNITQPLLAGFGTDVNRSGIEIARSSRDISELEFQRIVISTIQQVEDAYWNLVYTRENLDVARQTLGLAQDLLDQTRTRVRIGTSAPIDIVQSEATVAAREQDIIVAENAVDGAADLLKQLMGFEDPEDWKAVVLPVDSLETSPYSVGLDDAIDTALTKRVELKQQALSSHINELNVVSAHNAIRPRLDLVVNYGYAGVAGTFTDPETGQVVKEGWSDALQQITDRDFDHWSAGVSFSYPLGNNQAKATLAQRRYELTRAQQQLAAYRQGVIAEVRAAVRGLDAGMKSIAASVKARELAERNLDAEQKKFANGMSTNYQVLQIQEDLAAALVTELQSRVFYRQALVAYQVAVGDLLSTAGVRLVSADHDREPHQFLKDAAWLKWAHWTSPLAAGEAEGGPAVTQEEE